MIKIAIGSDHGGFDYKEKIKKELGKQYVFIDCGCYKKESCNYAEYAIKTAEVVASGEADFGVLICNSGEGVSIAANKVKGIRCGIGYNDDVACLLREHNDANMIAFGAHFMSYEEVIKRIEIFVNTKFSGERHEIRVDFIKKYENKN